MDQQETKHFVKRLEATPFSYTQCLRKTIFYFVLILAVIGIFMVTSARNSYAEPSAVVVAVDGLSFCLLVSECFGPLSEPFCTVINQTDPYLKTHLESMVQEFAALGIEDGDLDIVTFPWSRDSVDNTVGAINDLRDFLSYQYESKIQGTDKKLIVVSHSWGTYLAYHALGLGPKPGGNRFVVDLFITLSSPLHTAYMNLDWLFLTSDILVRDWVAFFDMLVRLSITDATEPSVYREWVNYWAYGDVFSGPIPIADDDIKVDCLDELWQRQAAFPYPTYTLHKYTSLEEEYSVEQACGTEVRSSVMYKIIKTIESQEPSGLIEPTITMTRPDSVTRVDQGISVWWSDSDPDSNAKITLWKDNNNFGYDGTTVLASGLSEDSQGSDGAYSIWTGNMPEGEEFYIYATIDDGNTLNYSTNYTSKIIVDHPSQGTDLSYATEWTDDYLEADGDGIAEAGERVNLRVRLRNNSSEPIELVDAVLSTYSNDIVLNSDRVYYDTIAPASTSWGGGPFNMTLNFNDTSNRLFTLYVTYRKNGSEYYDIHMISKTIYADGKEGPVFEVDHVEIDDTDPNAHGNGDGILQSGERVEFDLYLKNVGNADAPEVEAKVIDLRPSGYPFDVSENWENYPDLVTGGSAEKQEGTDFQDITIPYYFAGTIMGDVTVKYGQGQIEQTLENQPLFTVQPASWILTSPGDHDFGVTGTDSDIVLAVKIANIGTVAMTVNEITTSAADTTWFENPLDPLPWILQAGESKTVDVTIETTSLNGERITREVWVTSDAREYHLDKDDRVIITGLVSDMPPSYELLDAAGASYPDFGGNTVVWQSGATIYAHDLENSVTSLIINTGGKAKVSNKVVAWNDSRNWNGIVDFTGDVYAYDMTTEQEFVVSADPVNEELIGIDGDNIIYRKEYFNFVDVNAGVERMYNLYRYNLSTGSTSQLTFFTASTGVPIYRVSSPPFDADVGGGWVIYKRQRLDWDTEKGNWVYGPSDFWRCRSDNDDPPVLFSQAYGQVSANNGKILYGKYDSNNYLQLWVWDDEVQITTLEEDHGEDCFSIGNDFVVYDRRGDLGLYYFDTTLASNQEGLLTNSGDCRDSRMDGNGVVWVSGNKVFYVFLGADLSVSSSDIGLNNETLCDNETFDVTVKVHNIGTNATVENVTVDLYDGDPNAGGTFLGSRQIMGGIAASGYVSISIEGISLIEGEHTLYAICSTIASENSANNNATKTITVQDGDTFPPLISQVSIEEYNGDGDGIIRDDEQIRISWELQDPSGIGSTLLTVGGEPIAIGGSYFAILGPLSEGYYQVLIKATDADNSPETSTRVYPFTVTPYRSISGKIVLVGVPASVSDVLLTLSGDTSQTAYPDTSGNYSFTKLKDGSYVLTSALTDYHFSPASRSYSPLNSDEANQDFTGLHKTYDSEPDNLPDWWELVNFGNLQQDGNGDPDVDGLNNSGEYSAGTNPNDADSDDDSMPDGWEVTHGLEPLADDASGDLDGDRFNNLQEYLAETNPNDDTSSPEPDFGDAPDPTYVSMATNTGAAHLVFANEWLGDNVDGEADSIQVNADLFDNGVIFKGTLRAGVATDVDITVNVLDSMNATRYDSGDPRKRLYLNAWFDWNADGDWNDAGEKVIGTGSGIIYAGYTSDTVAIDPTLDFAGLSSAVFTFSITPPVDWSIGGYARIRLDYGEDAEAVQNISGNLAGYLGAAQFGEVEDYKNPLLALSTIDGNGGTITVTDPNGEHYGCQIIIPAGALNLPIDFSIQKVQNKDDFPSTPYGGVSILLEIGPTGTIFNTPITIIVPHDPSLVHGDSPQPYFWDEVNGEWSSDGISNVVYDESSDPHTVTFDTIHLTVFAVDLGIPAGTGGGGGGISSGGDGCFIVTGSGNTWHKR